MEKEKIQFENEKRDLEEKLQRLNREHQRNLHQIHNMHNLNVQELKYALEKSQNELREKEAELE